MVQTFYFRKFRKSKTGDYATTDYGFESVSTCIFITVFTVYLYTCT